MNNIKAMCAAVEKAASGYAERITREAECFSKIQCPAIDWCVRALAVDLVASGIVDPDKMFEFLDCRKYRENTPDRWWLD